MNIKPLASVYHLCRLGCVLLVGNPEDRSYYEAQLCPELAGHFVSKNVSCLSNPWSATYLVFKIFFFLQFCQIQLVCNDVIIVAIYDFSALCGDYFAFVNC